MAAKKSHYSEYSKGFHCSVCESRIPNEFSIRNVVYIRSRTFGDRYYCRPCFDRLLPTRREVAHV